MPNYGEPYREAFAVSYQRLARERDILFEPAMLLGIGEHLEMMQKDGIHPLPEVQGNILDHLRPNLKALVALIA